MTLMSGDGTAGVILAGGRSRRLGGGDKALLMVQGQALVGHVIARLAPSVAALAINANGDPARFAGFGVPVIADGIEGQPGPLAGILAGLDWAAAAGFARIVTAACDTPVFPRDLVPRLSAAGGLAVAATEGGAHPTFGVWPVSLRDELRSDILAGQRRVLDWVERRGGSRVVFPDPEGDLFFNVNTPQDLAAIRARLG